jgi:hypothetical protein
VNTPQERAYVAAAEGFRSMMSATMLPQSMAVRTKPLLKTVREWCNTWTLNGNLSGVMPVKARNCVSMIMIRFAITGRKQMLTAGECDSGLSL